ncbi:hypothetical protein D3C80_1517420 [compost metagenome]
MRIDQQTIDHTQQRVRLHLLRQCLSLVQRINAAIGLPQAIDINNTEAQVYSAFFFKIFRLMIIRQTGV